MKKPDGPCYGCELRIAENPELGTEDCHKSCELYAKYRQDLDEYKRSQLDERHKRRLSERPWVKRPKRKKTINSNHI